MDKYEKKLKLYIQLEKEGKLFDFSDNDRILLSELCSLINKELNYDVHYISQLYLYNYYGSGYFIDNYIEKFESEKIKSYLSRQIVGEKVENCARKIMNLYLHFKTSDEYKTLDRDINFITCLNYDWDFMELRSKKIKKELLELACNLRDAVYLMGTMKMLSTWRLPEMEIIAKKYLEIEKYTYNDFYINENDPLRDESLRVFKEDLKELGVYCLRYYPTEENKKIVEKYLYSEGSYINNIAASSLRKMGS